VVADQQTDKTASDGTRCSAGRDVSVGNVGIVVAVDVVHTHGAADGTWYGASQGRHGQACWPILLQGRAAAQRDKREQPSCR